MFVFLKESFEHNIWIFIPLKHFFSVEYILTHWYKIALNIIFEHFTPFINNIHVTSIFFVTTILNVDHNSDNIDSMRNHRAWLLMSYCARSKTFVRRIILYCWSVHHIIQIHKATELDSLINGGSCILIYLFPIFMGLAYLSGSWQEKFRGSRPWDPFLPLSSLGSCKHL